MERKHIFAAALVSAAAAGALLCAVLNTGVSAHSASDVSGFLKSCGINAAYSSEKEVTIPETFGEVYESYNALQKEQGFDLSGHRGHAATVYTFTVTDYTDESGERVSGVEAHVLVCDGKVIGGDIASTRLDGFMKGIK